MVYAGFGIVNGSAHRVGNTARNMEMFNYRDANVRFRYGAIIVPGRSGKYYKENGWEQIKSVTSNCCRLE